MSVLCFLALAVSCGVAAHVRARRAGDKFRGAILIPLAGVSSLVIASLGTRATFPVCLVFACACACAATDLSSGYIYDVLTYPSLAVLLLASSFNGTFLSAALWTLGSFGCITLLAASTRWRGLGLGDVKLFTVIAAGLGAPIAEVFGGSFVLGACAISIGLLRRRIGFGQTVPFAPYIAIATIVTVSCEAFLK